MDIGYWIFVSGAGLTLGAFTSRFLAENYYHILSGLNSLPQTALLSSAVALALLAFWRLYSAAWARRGKMPLAQALADDALTYTPLFLLLLYLAQREVNPLQAKVLLGGCLLLILALKIKSPLRKGSDFELWILNFGLPSALFALTFIVYLSTLSPTVGEADSFEFQVVSYTLGIAHPTGYPLYILLGKLFTLLPIGNVAYRVNLISPLFASLAVVCLYLCLVHLTRHRTISLLAALTFAFSRTFWSQAVIAEVYTLNAFFVALVLYLLLKGKPVTWKLLAAFVYGLSLTNHLTMALLSPAMAIYALLIRRRPFTDVKKVPPTMDEGLLTEPTSPRSKTFGDRRAGTLLFWTLDFELWTSIRSLSAGPIGLPLHSPALASPPRPPHGCERVCQPGAGQPFPRRPPLGRLAQT